MELNLKNLIKLANNKESFDMSYAANYFATIQDFNMTNMPQGDFYMMSKIVQHGHNHHRQIPPPRCEKKHPIETRMFNEIRNA